MFIEFQKELIVSVEEFQSVLIESTLGERRPVHDTDRLKQMLENANILITARENGNLIGIARSLSDFTFCTYVSDLAVSKKFQGQGIGKELLKRTQIASGKATIILLAAPAAINYYPKIGMDKYEHCYMLKADQNFK